MSMKLTGFKTDMGIFLFDQSDTSKQGLKKSVFVVVTENLIMSEPV